MFFCYKLLSVSVFLFLCNLSSSFILNPPSSIACVNDVSRIKDNESLYKKEDTRQSKSHILKNCYRHLSCTKNFGSILDKATNGAKFDQERTPQDILKWAALVNNNHKAALTALDKIKNPTILDCNRAIKACAISGRRKEALEIYEKLNTTSSSSLKPNIDTFSHLILLEYNNSNSEHVISFYETSKLSVNSTNMNPKALDAVIGSYRVHQQFPKALEICEILKVRNIDPQKEAYATFVDIGCRKGLYYHARANIPKYMKDQGLNDEAVQYVSSIIDRHEARRPKLDKNNMLEGIELNTTYKVHTNMRKKPLEGPTLHVPDPPYYDDIDKFPSEELFNKTFIQRRKLKRKGLLKEKEYI